MTHKTRLIVLTFASLTVHASYGINDSDIDLSNFGKSVISLNADKNTGLNKIYVAFDVSEGEIKYISHTGSRDVRWYKYSNLGGGFSEEISNIQHEGALSILSKPEGNMGYIIEDGSDRFYFWLVDYSKYVFDLKDVSFPLQNDCDRTILNINASSLPIHYYSINGQQKILSREILLSYDTIEWDEKENSYRNIEKTEVLDNLSETLYIYPPAYISTFFHFSGDRFLKEWNMIEDFETPVFNPHSVEVKCWAVQNNTDNEEASNIIRNNNDGLGGSAPAEITFYSATSEAVVHNEWQMSKDAEFEDILYRFNEKDLTYIFEEEGTFYVRFIGSNSDGSCESVSDLFTISIGASELKCPNAFSPDDDGVNDLWKVAYRSLIDFKCWIFSRNGQLLYESTDPSQGWDGKINGKTAKPGVYYYVIQATGADGKKYKKSGDINILRKKVLSTSSEE